MSLKLDRPLTAVLLSIIGDLVSVIYTTIMKYFEFATLTSPVVISMMFIREGSMFLGILASIGFSTVVGLTVYYSAKVLGADYFPIKSMIITMTAEAVLVIVFGTLANNPHLAISVTEHYVHASSAALAGLTRGLLIKRYLL